MKRILLDRFTSEAHWNHSTFLKKKKRNYFLKEKSLRRSTVLLDNLFNKAKEMLKDDHVPWKQMYIYSLSSIIWKIPQNKC